MSASPVSVPGATAVVVVAALLLPACGTPGRPIEQSIWIETPQCSTASCELRNDAGRWTLERTPGRVTVTSSTAPLEIVCWAGPVRSSATSPSARLPASGGAAVVGGLAGAGAMGAYAGAAVLGPFAALAVLAVVEAAAIGATAGYLVEEQARPLAYPERIVLPLVCDPADHAGPVFGFVVRGFTDDEIQRAGLPGDDGALVVAVPEGGRASAAGLRAGDVVLRANGIAIDSARRLEALVRALPPDRALDLTVQRGATTIEVSVPALQAR